MILPSKSWEIPSERPAYPSLSLASYLPKTFQAKKPNFDIDEMVKRVRLPVMRVTDEELAETGYVDRGRTLIRQDSWDELSEAIRHADRARLATPGGSSIALLLAHGARSEIAAVDNPQDMANIANDRPQDYPLALVAALAHIDVASSWRCLSGERDPHTNAARVAFHLSEASDILSRYTHEAFVTPSLTAALATLTAELAQPAHDLSVLYERLIAMEPATHQHMRRFGRHILAAPEGGPAALEVAARRIAVMTEETWGAGGYVWVYIDALSHDTVTLDLIDPEYFTTGLADILERCEDQHVVNTLAAFCAVTMRPRLETPQPPHAEAACAKIHAFFDLILQHHLRELHPLIWSQSLSIQPAAPDGPLPRRALITTGRQTALRIIATRLARDISKYSEIAFPTAESSLSSA